MVLNLKNIQTSDPKRFWSEMNKLGPRRSWKIPMEVLGNDGSLVTGLSDVINRWDKDFKGLFSSEMFDFDGGYYEDLCQRKNVIEGHILQG